MLKVFLVEDEKVIRESLRDNIPWNQAGFEFAGEAGDGEMALPLIRKVKPDLVITDIKMPFMDGLSLSHILRGEFPEMKIVIISGYDDFEYARTAIKEGVDQYLLKPVTRNTLLKTLDELRMKIESERESIATQNKFQEEMKEYEEFFFRNFFEKVCENKLSIQEIYEEAAKYSIDINATAYNMILVAVPDSKLEEMEEFFARFTFCRFFRLNMGTYGILIKGENENIKDRTDTCMIHIERILGMQPEDWYVAIGDPVERFSQLPDCFKKLNHIFAYRFFSPKDHILTETLMDAGTSSNDDSAVLGVNTAQVDPTIIRNFLVRGQHEEVNDFVDNYFASVKDALKSNLFRDYMLLSIRFAAIGFVEERGYAQSDFNELVDETELLSSSKDNARLYENACQMLKAAISIRDRELDSQGKKLISQALLYIDDNYTDEKISLNSVAKYSEVSPSYLSAMFSQERGQTFIEYVTEKRMNRAKELLKEGKLHTSEIAAMVGYKDSHYFSFVFKKTVGMSPREYKNS